MDILHQMVLTLNLINLTSNLSQQTVLERRVFMARVLPLAPRSDEEETEAGF